MGVGRVSNFETNRRTLTDDTGDVLGKHHSLPPLCIAAHNGHCRSICSERYMAHPLRHPAFDS